MVAVDGYFEMGVVGVVLIGFRPIISQDEMIFKGSLKGFADEIVEGDYFILSG